MENEDLIEDEWAFLGNIASLVELLYFLLMLDLVVLSLMPLILVMLILSLIIMILLVNIEEGIIKAFKTTGRVIPLNKHILIVGVFLVMWGLSLSLELNFTMDIHVLCYFFLFLGTMDASNIFFLFLRLWMTNIGGYVSLMSRINKPCLVMGIWGILMGGGKNE